MHRSATAGLYQAHTWFGLEVLFLVTGNIHKGNQNIRKSDHSQSANEKKMRSSALNRNHRPVTVQSLVDAIYAESQSLLLHHQISSDANVEYRVLSHLSDQTIKAAGPSKVLTAGISHENLLATVYVSATILWIADQPSQEMVYDIMFCNIRFHINCSKLYIWCPQILFAAYVRKTPGYQQLKVVRASVDL